MDRTVLLIDDDHKLGGMLAEYLGDRGFRVEHRADVQSGLRALRGGTFEALILDVMLPDGDGFEVCRTVRAEGDIPILMLTGRGDELDRIVGLELGADDYLPKPFEPMELLLRIRTILRRVSEAPRAMANDDTVRFGEMRFDPRQDQLFRGDHRVRLTEAETGLLRAFVDRAGQPLSREDLLACNAVNGNTRTVDVQVTRLRRKLEEDPKFPRYLQTVRGLGYVLRVDP